MVATWTSVGFIWDVWFVGISTVETNITGCTLPYDSPSLAELLSWAICAVTSWTKSCSWVFREGAARAKFTVGERRWKSLVADTISRAFLLDSSLACESRWAEVTSRLSCFVLNCPIWTNDGLTSAGSAEMLRRTYTTSKCCGGRSWNCWLLSTIVASRTLYFIRDSACTIESRWTCQTHCVLVINKIGFWRAGNRWILSRIAVSSLGTSSWNSYSTIKSDICSFVGGNIGRWAGISSHTNETLCTRVCDLGLTDSTAKVFCCAQGAFWCCSQAESIAECSGWTRCRINHADGTVVALKTRYACSHAKFGTVHPDRTWKTRKLLHLIIVGTRSTRLLNSDSRGTIVTDFARVTTIDSNWCGSCRDCPF